MGAWEAPRELQGLGACLAAITLGATLTQEWGEGGAFKGEGRALEPKWAPAFLRVAISSSLSYFTHKAWLLAPPPNGESPGGQWTAVSSFQLLFQEAQ